MVETASVADASSIASPVKGEEEKGTTVTQRGKSIARLLRDAPGPADRKAGSWGWEMKDCGLSEFAPTTEEEAAREGWT